MPDYVPPDHVPSDYARDLDLAIRLADIADAITTDRFGALDLKVQRKPDRSPVTDADTSVEDSLRALLAVERPTDAIAGEEGGGDTSSVSRTWVIDPIDGTKNFLRGLPVWATLIALVENGVPVVGMISAPLLARRWWASTGAGAWRRDDTGEQQISVSKVSQLEDAYLSTTQLRDWTKYHSRSAYLALVDACWENRAFGDFWQHCLVAEGAIDLAAESIVNPWDVAAVQVLVTEAGGRFSDLTGKPGFTGGSALSSNGLVHEPALAILQQG